MKRILKQGVYRIKCPYCDCEFEYEREDVVSKSLKILLPCGIQMDHSQW